jgi:hypothetical protein
MRPNEIKITARIPAMRMALGSQDPILSRNPRSAADGGVSAGMSDNDGALSLDIIQNDTIILKNSMRGVRFELTNSYETRPST